MGGFVVQPILPGGQLGAYGNVKWAKGDLGARGLRKPELTRPLTGHTSSPASAVPEPEKAIGYLEKYLELRWRTPPRSASWPCCNAKGTPPG